MSLMYWSVSGVCQVLYLLSVVVRKGKSREGKENRSIIVFVIRLVCREERNKSNCEKLGQLGCRM